MNDEEVARLANIVSERVFKSMSRFVAALEDIVRENELLRTKVEHLEMLVFGPAEDEPQGEALLARWFFDDDDDDDDEVDDDADDADDDLFNRN